MCLRDSEGQLVPVDLSTELVCAEGYGLAGGSSELQGEVESVSERVFEPEGDEVRGCLEMAGELDGGGVTGGCCDAPPEALAGDFGVGRCGCCEDVVGGAGRVESDEEPVGVVAVRYECGEVSGECLCGLRRHIGGHVHSWRCQEQRTAGSGAQVCAYLAHLWEIMVVRSHEQMSASVSSPPSAPSSP